MSTNPPETTGQQPTPPSPAPVGAQYGSQPYPAYGTQPYAAYGSGPNPFGPPRPSYDAPPSRTMAVWAMVLGWIPFVPTMIVSIVLGCIVIGRSKDGRKHGKMFAILGFVGVAVWVAVVVAILVVRPFSPHRDSSGHLTSGGTVTIDGLRPGDCGAQQLSGITGTVHVVPCSRPHVFEVMARFELHGDAYPGDRTVVRLSEGGCVQRLSHISQLKGRNDLSVTYLHPIERTWSNQKSVVCMVNSDQPITGAVVPR